MDGLVERQARGFGNNGQGQSSSSKGNSFNYFKRLGPPFFSVSSDLTKAKAWIMKIEFFFFFLMSFIVLRNKKPNMQPLC